MHIEWIAFLLLICLIYVSYVFLHKSAEIKALLIKNAVLEEANQQNGIIKAKYENLLVEFARMSATYDQERKHFQEKLLLLENAEKHMSETFKSISTDALLKNNQSFLELAKNTFEHLHEQTKSENAFSKKTVENLVNPIKNALNEVTEKMNEIENIRIETYGSLKQQINNLLSSNHSMSNAANSLTSALKSPNISGKWGEIQLRRVAEISGMIEHCDFQEQVHISEGEKNVRPDMIFYLPGGMQIIVDAKTTLSSFLNAIDAIDEKKRIELLKEHARQVKDQIKNLSSKRYPDSFQAKIEFVILFLPNEAFLSVALEYDPSLIEFAWQKGVILATPTILLALLRTVAMGWKQEKMLNNTQKIIEMGQELYKRLSIYTEHVSSLGKNISSTVTNYNKMVASLEGRVLSNVRQFNELQTSENQLLDLKNIDLFPTTMKSKYTAD